MAKKIKRSGSFATRVYRSKIAEAVHNGISGLHRLGLVDKKIQKDFDARCLTVEVSTPSFEII